MILDSPNKHLTDQEFFTHIKFLLLMSGKFDEDEDKVSLTLLSIGEEEEYEIFSRIYMAWQFTETDVLLDKGVYGFEESFSKAKEEIDKKPDNEKKELKKLLNKVTTGKTFKAEEVVTLSWV